MVGQPSTQVKLFANLTEAAAADPQAVLAQLQTDAGGLRWEEARRRLGEFGPNELSSQRPPPWPAVLWAACRHPFNGVLLALGAISHATGDAKAAVVMATMIILSVGLRFWQEMKSLVQAESLQRLVRNETTVVRTGAAPPGSKPNPLDARAVEIPTADLVPGDIVLFSAGDMIPADLRLITSRDLFVTQSALTGEAMPVEKFDRERGAAESRGEAPRPAADVLDSPHLLFMGTSIVSGTARAVVLATGNRTYFGAMAAKLTGQRPVTAFDRGVRSVSWLLIRFMLVMAPAVFLLNGLLKHDWLEALLFAVAIAVGLTPEMLPMIVNANLARGAIALARRKTIVKRLHAIQNFGAMDVLCTDKTGTLTEGRIELERHLDLAGSPSERVLLLAYVNSRYETGLRSPLDEAILRHGHLDIAGWRKLDEVPFD